MALAGVFTAMVTPFSGDAIDEEGLVANIAHQIESGVTGLVLLGTTGEDPTLTEQECEQVIRIAVREAKGKVLVVVGTGHCSTVETIKKTATAEALGADLALVVTPYYNRPTQEGLYQHYKAIAEANSIPFLLYNNPLRTGVNLEPSTLQRLTAIPTIVGLKECSGSMVQVAEMVRVISEGVATPSFALFSGDDCAALPMMALGAVGVISVASNAFPNEMVAFVRTLLEERYEEAREWHYRLFPLFKALFLETNPGPIKEMMAMCNRAAGPCRLPLARLKRESRAQLQEVLEKLYATQ